MTGVLYRLGRACGRHGRAVIGAWALAAIALAVGAQAAGQRTSDDLTLPGTGSTRATDLLERRLPKQAYGTNPLVLRARDGRLTDAANRDAVEATVDAVRRVPHVTRAPDPLGSDRAALLSGDGRIANIPVTLDLGPGDLTEDQAQAVLDAAAPARRAGLDAALGGYAGSALSRPSTHVSEAVGIAAAVVVLLFAFGSAVAMALPIVTAVLGVVTTLSIITLLGHAFEVPSVAPTLATMIGLGVGIDYALFIVTRHKLQRRDGMDVEESTARAAATAGGAVLFAGGTVVIALCSLALAGIPLVTTLGVTAAVAVLVAVVAATTLLPALLGALGPRIDALRVRLGRTHPDDHQPHGWERWARGVARRPRHVLVVSVALLLVLALPVRNLELGQSDVGALPTSTTARQAYDMMSEGFGPGSNGPLLVSVRLGTPARPASGQQSAATDPRLAGLVTALEGTADVASVSTPTLDARDTAAVITVVARTAPSDHRTEQLVDRLRGDVIPTATRGTDMTAYVGGQTAGYIDLAARISDKLPSMIAVVVGLSCVVLLVAFRSLVVPVKAALMNLLSVAAAYGVVTFIFQEGHGAQLIGLDGAIPIVSFVPLLMFAILFGLSMDYEVFLLTQMQERYARHRRPVRAVVDGLARTGRVITSAALIMVCVFASFVLNGDPVVKQFGVGLAVAIAIDATVVRCFSVPAVMALLGRASWWLPPWLERAIPRVSIEGESYFAERAGVARRGPEAHP